MFSLAYLRNLPTLNICFYVLLRKGITESAIFKKRLFPIFQTVNPQRI